MVRAGPGGGHATASFLRFDVASAYSHFGTDSASLATFFLISIPYSRYY